MQQPTEVQLSLLPDTKEAPRLPASVQSECCRLLTELLVEVVRAERARVGQGEEGGDERKTD